MSGSEETYRLGLLGEMKAEKYLSARGLKVKERRYRAGGGEIDLICEEKDTICFVEVKYRPRGTPGEGFLAVDPRKRERIRQAAGIYLKGRKAEKVRFDVLEITAAGIDLIRGAF